MKSKQLCPKSVRPSSTNSTSTSINKQRVRCSLCDSLLKASTSHRYFLMGKSIHDKLNNNITYNECCQRYLNETYESDKLNMICPKCCQDLQRVYSLHHDAEELTEKIRHTCYKTKRLNRTRHSRYNVSRNNETISSSPLPTIAIDDNMILTIKEEIEMDQIPLEIEMDQIPLEIKLPMEQSPITVSESVLANTPYDLSINQQRLHKNLYSTKIPHQPYDNNNNHQNETKRKPRVQKQPQSLLKTANINSQNAKKSHQMGSYPTFLPTQTSQQVYQNGHDCYSNILYHSTSNSLSASPYAQLMIESASSSPASPHQQRPEVRRRSSSNSEQTPLTVTYEASLDEDRSLSPRTNDDETSSINESKSTRLSRRQYNFLVKLPDQQSLNAFIESSSSESGSRWTWRRTSANSRGYKVYYVCNFSMRRHYHPCPAAMYALFHPEGSISIYSCGEHQHIPKDRLPVSITDATKDEIFKCLQSGMATTDIREHLTRLQLPFGDTRKLNNFIKYHKELLRFGTVTNVRVGGTAYRQPQCWAIRRQSSGPPPPPSTINNETTPTTPTTS